ncbi:hypothetical protein F4811DRAFT_548801 [Daldinia bambusicola]|nr:hypothetical protein F4811DRAFT_548801 [Daldinia bambusicola]
MAAIDRGIGFAKRDTGRNRDYNHAINRCLQLSRRQASTNQKACAKFGLAADNFDFANRLFHAKQQPGNGAGGLGFCGNAALLDDARMSNLGRKRLRSMQLSAR